jgi:hypothetical protein
MIRIHDFPGAARGLRVALGKFGGRRQFILPVFAPQRHDGRYDFGG